MSVKPNGNSRKGFASRPKKERVELARKAGSAKNPNKGYGSIAPEERSRLSREAVQKRWDAVRAQREAAVAPDNVDSGESAPAE